MGGSVSRSEAARQISERSGYDVSVGVLQLSWEGAVLFPDSLPNYEEADVEQGVRVAELRRAGWSLQRIRLLIGHVVSA